MITLENLYDVDYVAHGFMTRRDGHSSGIYDSLNCGFGSDDLEENVRRNRREAVRRVGMGDAPLVTCYQIHSPTVVTVTAPWDAGNAPEADAMVTDRPGLVLGILTADCTPVLLADEKIGVIGAAHAGWRGAAGGVLQATVEAMVALGAKAEHIHAGIGPCIHQESYEVGPEFYNELLALSPENAGFFIPSDKENHHMFDLPGYVTAELKTLGLSSVRSTGLDTYSRDSLFYSYRRNCHQGLADYGRGISVIAIRDEA